MDYQGAMDSFEKALEVNPRNASAHFELAWLSEYKVPDPAVAIYHYQCFLKLQPNSDNADKAREHIGICKQQLAASVSAIGLLPSTAQRDLEKVLLENKDLKARLVQWEAYYTSHRQTPSNAPAANPTPAQPREVAAVVRQTPEPVPLQTTRAASEKAATTSRSMATVATKTHTVKTGESFYAIAKRYSISTGALQSANPQVRPTRIQPGQTLTIPAP
ncbi:MAG: hypothetical protein JWQ71_4364 [Pedosphaera sp.]|nr:hypothetical protein [Pedosphaera sp.]